MKKFVSLIVLVAVILSFASFFTVQAEVISPFGQGQIGYQAVVLCETLSVRNDPSTSSKTVKTLRYGTKLLVTRQTNGWAECVLSDDVNAGPAGWVKADYLAINPAWFRADAKTTAYAWNSTSAPKVGLLEKNTMLPILKMEGNWIIVSLRGAVGFIRV